ncbi:MAG: acyl-CoA thioester hydrolase [Gammaproteobacteria bacterium]|jgi:acyl-CoA thioester hydrolase
MSRKKAFGEFPWPIRIYYEDTDAGGIVYHANYLKFMERARTEWLRECGFEQTVLAEHFGVVFVVRKILIDYLCPARLNDQILVCSSVKRLGHASIEFGQNILCADQILSRGEVKVGCLDTESMRPKRIPPEVYLEISDA